MCASSLPIIAFELGVGEFRIVTPEAVYQIRVCHDLVEATRIDNAALSGDHPAGNASTPPTTFFKEISEELFEKVGQLARKLSVSVEELPGQIKEADLDAADQQLENAKGQLEEIVKITEKASMSIMDSADQILVDMEGLKSQLEILRNLDLMNAGDQEPAPSADSLTPQAAIIGKPPISDAFFDKLGEMKSFIEGLLNGGVIAGPSPAEPPEPEPEEPAPPAAQEAPPAIQIISVTRFDADVVFQTLYELCTNESVKDHIKSMREEQASTFNTVEIVDKLSEMAPTVDEEDGFFNFPITAVLKTIYAATASEDFRNILKKMNQTAASIFLDSVLPIEGEITEMEVPAAALAAPAPMIEPEPEPEPPAAPALIQAESESGPIFSLDHLKTIQSLVDELEGLGQDGQPDGPVAETSESHGRLYTTILTQDRDAIVGAVSAAQRLIGQTGAHLTRILETLSFQDLSGQRIMKVVSMIGDIQMQLIAILVSVNTKMKVHRESEEMGANSATAVKMAQEEVDKALEKVSAGGSSALLGPGAEARLDQGAVNDLLSQLGF